VEQEGILLDQRENVGDYFADVGLVAALFCAISLVTGYLIPKLAGVVESQAIASSALAGAAVDYFEDADFLKLRDVSVSFDVPPAAASLVRARGATITLVGRNLLTWTGYSGVDPEAGSYPLSFGVDMPNVADYGALPPLRSWTLRVQLAY